MIPKSDWFRIAEVAKDIYVVEERYHVQSYLVNGKDRSALIDTGMGFRDIQRALHPLLRDDVIVLNTHWHYDHVGGNRFFESVGISPLERALVEKGWSQAVLMELHVRACLRQGVPLPVGFDPESYEIPGTVPAFDINDGDRFDLGDRVLEAIATPGHTHGSTSFLDRATRSVFVGDWVDRGTLFVHFEDSDLDEYLDSLRKIHRFRGEFDWLLPGHNTYPLPAAFLDDAETGFQDIREGRVKGQAFNEGGTPTLYYPFDEFGVLVKRAGSVGFKLNPLV